MKIYTKTGDKGTTALIGGRRSKADLRVNSYGKLDSLNSYLNIVISMNPSYADELVRISKYLFTVGYDLSNLNDDEPQTKIEEISWLESRIDFYQAAIGDFNQFVLPGGTIIASHLHYARTLCRECERVVVSLAEIENVEEVVNKYINRLSDYIYLLACYENFINEQPLIPISIK